MKRNGNQLQADLEDRDSTAADIDSPHELLGIAAAETDPLVIVDAARSRLDAIRGSHGSETELKHCLLVQITGARDEMLRRAGVAGRRPGGVVTAPESQGVVSGRSPS